MGEFLVENGVFGLNDFDEIKPFLDMEKVATQYIQTHNAMLCDDNTYIEDILMPEEQTVLYDGTNLPSVYKNGFTVDEESIPPFLT